MYIYGLCDPRTKEVRYIGASKNPKERLNRHIRSKESTHKWHWINSLLQQYIKPELFIIEDVPNDNWQWFEKFWIKQYKINGANLTNGTDGGDGVLGLRHSEESRHKMSISKKGMPSPNKGKHATEETRHKQSIAKIGKPSGAKGTHHSEEKRRKQSERFRELYQEGVITPPSQKGKKFSVEIRDRMCVSQKVRREREKKEKNV